MIGDERGSGLVGTVSGVGAFLVLLFVAASVLVHLYATSVVSAAAFDAARVASGARNDESRAAAAADAEVNARRLLGRYAGDARFEWLSLGPEFVVLRVTADSPALLPATVTSLAGLDSIERTVRLRAEGFR